MHKATMTRPMEFTLGSLSYLDQFDRAEAESWSFFNQKGEEVFISSRRSEEFHWPLTGTSAINRLNKGLREKEKIFLFSRINARWKLPERRDGEQVVIESDQAGPMLELTRKTRMESVQEGEAIVFSGHLRLLVYTPPAANKCFLRSSREDEDHMLSSAKLYPATGQLVFK